MPAAPCPSSPTEILARNSIWAANIAESNPDLLARNAAGQSPTVLWIGCSDSRVPETTILDLLPGEVFTHRNIANVVPVGDLSVESVVQYAVAVLKVKHVVVCGHYGCGGVQAALGDAKLGRIDAWLANIRAVRDANKETLDKITDEKEKWTKLVDLNVLAQVENVHKLEWVQDAIKEGRLDVHAWVYDLASGRLSEVKKD
ncbi:hypothetical protein YB2330_001540 [Saitoella coloradoensis]